MACLVCLAAGVKKVTKVMMVILAGLALMDDLVLMDIKDCLACLYVHLLFDTIGAMMIVTQRYGNGKGVGKGRKESAQHTAAGVAEGSEKRGGTDSERQRVRESRHQMRQVG